MSDLVGDFHDSIEIYYNETFENLEMKNHFHNLNEIIYIIEGKAEFKINSKIYSASRGDIIFISNLETHELKVVKYPYKRYFILIDPGQFQLLINQSILASMFKHRPEHFRHVTSLEGNPGMEIREIIRKMHDEYLKKETFWEYNLGSYLYLLFVQLYRGYREAFPLSTLNSSTNMILDIQKYVEQHYTEEISLKDLSRKFYSNMFYVSHLFKKITGFTFKEYIILLRISKAKNLLFHTREDVTSVSMSSGFNSVNHFIRIFKKYEGLTPYQYRKMRKI